jgi:membrane associated rhomboid family serine protease
MDRDKSPPPDRRRELLRYAGLSTEVFASVGLSVFLGIKADKWFHVPFPILAWLLPLLVIVVLIIKLVKETSKRKDGN